MRKVIIVLTPLVVIFGAIFMIAVLGALRPEPEEAPQGAGATAVFVAPAQARDVTLSVQTQGEVRPRREIDLIPEVGGRVTSVAASFIDGGAFSEGDVLLQIEPADYRLAVTRARASVAEAQQALTREQAEADLARAEWEELGEGEATPLALRQPQLDQARARLAASEASLQEAELALTRTAIRAPFDGRVRSKSADMGQYVSPGQALGRIYSTEVAEVPLPLTDAQLGLTGLPLAFFAEEGEAGPEVVLEAVVGGQARHWRGRIVRTDAAIDPQTRVVYAIAEVEDPYGAGSDAGAPLAIGLFVNAEIAGRQVADAVVIPRAGLRNLDEVYVAADDVLEIRRVDVINAGPETAVLAGGVDHGEMIVVSPVQQAVEGMGLSTLPVDDAAAGSGAAIASAGAGDPS